MRYTDDLDHYKTYPPTNSCYLDGRYFNRVFSKYPGLISEPLNIVITKHKDTEELHYRNYMRESPIDNQYPGLLRVIINTPETRHSNLLLLDYIGAKVYRFDPYGKSSPYYTEINKIIENYLDQYIDFDLIDIDYPVSDIKNPVCVANGIQGGFCVGYVIKFGYDYLNGRQFDPSDILRFVRAAETIYGPLPEIGKDIEYGFLDGKGRNVLIGALGGALLGGVITRSPGGALVGGLGGGLLGGIL